MKAEEVRKADATGLEAIDHTELRDEPTDNYVRFDRRNGLVGVAFPRFLDGRKISQGTDVIRRAELGKLIADPNNEMLGKAFVNRMWAHFFGRGFVNPVDDFGPHNPPSHPELLDKLAEEFKKSGYDVKKLCRWIMASRAYQLSSIAVRTKGADKDDGLFSQMQLKPMSPEQLFDSLLTATMAHRAGSGDDGNRRRDAWLRQFIFAFANDEDRGIDQLSGDDSPGAHDDERRAHADGALWQARQLPVRSDRAGPAARKVARRPTWWIPSTWRPSAGIRRPKSSREHGSISNLIRTAFRSCKTCSGLSSIPTSLS